MNHCRFYFSKSKKLFKSRLCRRFVGRPLGDPLGSVLRDSYRRTLSYVEKQKNTLGKGEKEEGRRVLRDTHRVTESEDTTSNRRSNGRYSLRCIPDTVITSSEIQKVDMGNDLWIPVTGDTLTVVKMSVMCMRSELDNQ